MSGKRAGMYLFPISAMLRVAGGVVQTLGDTCYVVQDTQQSNIYRVFHPLHFLVAIVQMPTDSQYMLDSKLLSALVKAMNSRYRIK